MMAMGLVMCAGCATDGRQPASIEGCGNGVLDQLQETCDDGNLVSGDGCSSDCRIEETIIAHWTLENSAGEAQLCPASFDTVDVIAMTLRVSVPVASFPCVDGEGTFEMHELPRSPTNGFLLQIRRGGTDELFSQTMSFGLPGGPTLDHPFDVRFKVTTDIGRLGLPWKLSRAGAPGSCEALGVTSIGIDAIPATGPTIMLTGTCSDMDYTTDFLKTGTYRIEMRAISTAGMGHGALDGVKVPTGGLLTRIPPIDIAF